MSSGPYPLVRAALMPLIAVSCAGMGVSGAYLVYAGFFSSIWTVAVAFFFSPLLFPFLMVPAAMFGNAMHIFEARRPMLAHVLHGCSLGWLCFVMSAWGAVVFELAAEPMTKGGVITGAAAMWCVAGSVGPWAVFVSSDKGNVLMTLLSVMLGIAALASAALTLGTVVPFWARCGMMTGVMFVLAVAQTAYESRMAKKS